jgi:glycogen operon protein
MLCHGDELGRTQQGNNNGYCQDNELTWIDWSALDEELLAFTSKVSALRRDHPVFRRRRFFEGRPVRRGDSLPDIAWFAPDGREMTEDDWESGFGRSIAVYLNGDGIRYLDARGQRVADDSFLLCFSAHDEPIDFTMPGDEYCAAWQLVLDTMGDDTEGTTVAAGKTVPVGPRALVVLQRSA